MKMDLVLNNQQWLICHKTKENQTKQNQTSIYKYIDATLKSVSISLFIYILIVNHFLQ